MKIVVFLLIAFCPLCQAKNEETPLVDFSSIRKILQNDNLEAVVKQKEERAAKRAVASLKKEVGMFNLPRDEDFWGFISELWLVRNLETLKWDFNAADYGIESSFGSFLANMGRVGTRFKILLINSANVAHFALPGNNGEPLFVVSLPFIRALDLSKLQISLLLYEDLLRFEADFFRNFVLDDKTKSFIGSNFHKKPYPEGILDSVLAKYDKFILEKGFSFKQQFQVTNLVDGNLKSKPSFQNDYRLMIEKKDKLVKSHISFRRYSHIYPSPELQMNWLTSKRESP